MKLDEQLKERMLQIGQMMSTVEIDPSFWDPSQPYWQNTNNHVYLIMRQTYQRMEYDEDFKKVFGAVLDKMVWLHVTAPEWRARISWMTWFLQLYVVDKQIVREDGKYLMPEVWTDPRRWKTAEGMETGLEVNVSHDSAGGLGVEGSH